MSPETGLLTHQTLRRAVEVGESACHMRFCILVPLCPPSQDGC
jgi:hypothetical protein